MKKLLVILALFSCIALYAQDALVQFWAGDASYNFHTFVGPDGSTASDGWLIRFVLDAGNDGIDGLDPSTKQPMGDDQFCSNNNFWQDYLNGGTAVGVEGCWYASMMLLVEETAGSPSEPVANFNDNIYFVLYNNADPDAATYYCTSTSTLTLSYAAGSTNDAAIENWNDTAWTAFVHEPDFNDATAPVPADGAYHVATTQQLAFDYDDASGDVPATLAVYLRADDAFFVDGDMIANITYTSAGTYNVATPALTNGVTYYWMVEPLEATRAISRKADVSQRNTQQVDNRFPAWSFTVIGESQTQTVPGSGTATYTYEDGTQVQVTLTGGAGGNLTIVQWPEVPSNIPIPANTLPLWFNIDPTGSWTEFPVNIIFTWTAPAPSGDTYFDLVYYNGTSWVTFVDGDDGVINGHNYAAAPYWVNFDAYHFTPFAMSDGIDTPLPVTFTNFSAVFANTFDYVTLSWTTESENDMLGYHVLRSETNDVTTAVRITGEIIPAGNSSAETIYSAVDEEIAIDKTYYYWVEGYELDGQTLTHGSVQVTTNKPDVPVVHTTLLNGAYPNPFNPSTKIQFSVKQGETASLTIYNVLGQVVKTYDRFDTGTYSVEWNGRDDHNSAVGSGIYFYKLQTQSYSKIMKMLLLK